MPKSSAAHEIPPPLELQCLRALWSLGAANVRAVQQALAPNRELAYTTIMTVLERLVRKGVVGRRKDGRAFLYEAVVSREALRAIALRQLLESFFEGSQDELLSYLRGRAPEPRTAVREPALAVLETELDTALL
jgi:predicted transcriptional regulator